MFSAIICDPDGKVVEGRATGFFYTMLSRATTLGDPDGKNSAIYFIGPHLTKERIQNITLKTNSNQTLINVKRRSLWVAHLESHVFDTQTVDPTHMQAIIEWAGGRIPYSQLFTRTNEYIANSKKTTIPKRLPLKRKL